MAFDPTPLLNALRQNAESSRSDLDTLVRLAFQRQRDEQRRVDDQRAKELEVGLQFALDPDLDTNALLGTAKNLTPAQVDFIRSVDKSAAKKRKAAEAATSPGARAVTDPVTGGVGGGPPGREEVLQSLRTIETGIAGRPSTAAEGFAPETQRAFQSVARTSQQRVGQAQASAQERRREVADAGRARLVEGLGLALAATPEQRRPAVLSQARAIAQRSFPQASEEVMAQIVTESVLSDVQGSSLTENQLRAAERGAAIRDGAPPRLANLAARGRAFKDPLTGVWRQGSPTGQSASQAGVRAGLVDVFSQLEALTLSLAQAGGANALTGTLEDLRRTLGARGDAIFGAFDATLANAQSLIQKARSGAVLNEEEIKLLERALPAAAQVKLVNGRLAPEVRSRLNAVFRVLEAEHLGAFDRSQKPKARRAFMEVKEESSTRLRSQLIQEFRELGIPIETPPRPKRLPPASEFMGIDPKSGNNLWRDPDGNVFEDVPGNRN